MASDSSVPAIDTLLHEPARLRVLALLAVVDQADFMYLLRQTALSRGNLSVQLSKLESAGIVGLERRLAGNRSRTSYFLTQEGRHALRGYKRTMLRLLGGISEQSKEGGN